MHDFDRFLRRARRGLLTAVLAAAVVAGAQPAAAVASTPVPPLVGIDGDGVLGLAPSQWDTWFAQMAANGVQAVRLDTNWNFSQPQAPTKAGPGYDWAWDDEIASALARHGLRWLPIIDFSTSWSASYWVSSGLLQPRRPDLQSPPQSAFLPDYAAYAAAFVKRYGPGGSFWAQNPGLPPRPITDVQIWNEPNIQYFWAPRPNAGAYASMYQQARAAILAVQPGEQVTLGALADPATDYLSQLIQILGGTAQITSVADDPYGDSPAGVADAVQALRNTLNAAGDRGAGIEVSEFGWPTSGQLQWLPTMTDEQRAVALGQTMRLLATGGYGVSVIAPYTWMTSEQDPGNADEWFGIVHPSGSPTASLGAFSTTARQIESGAIYGRSGGRAHRRVVRHARPHRRRAVRRHARRRRHGHRHSAKPAVRRAARR